MTDPERAIRDALSSLRGAPWNDADEKADAALAALASLVAEVDGLRATMEALDADTASVEAALRELVAADDAVEAIHFSLTDGDDNAAMAAKLHGPVLRRKAAWRAVRAVIQD